MQDQRFRQSTIAAWVGIIGNIVLAVMKAIVGLMANSKALIADAAHSASDVLGSIAVLIGIRAARIPPDKDHPYGHGKAESIAAIVVSVMLFVVGLEVGISAIRGMVAGVEAPPKTYALIAVAISIVAKEAMFQYKFRLGRRLGSQVLIADAWHHRSDALSSIAVLIGISAAVIGGMYGQSWLYYMDPIAGVLVAMLVLRMGYKLAMESIHSTLDHVLHEEDAGELVESVGKVSGVVKVDDLRARELGHYVIVDVKISVSPGISVQEGHHIGKQVKKMLIRRYEHVSDVFVHVNPYDSLYPYKNDSTGGTNNQGPPNILQ